MRRRAAARSRSAATGSTTTPTRGSCSRSARAPRSPATPCGRTAGRSPAGAGAAASWSAARAAPTSGATPWPGTPTASSSCPRAARVRPRSPATPSATTSSPSPPSRATGARSTPSPGSPTGPRRCSRRRPGTSGQDVAVSLVGTMPGAPFAWDGDVADPAAFSETPGGAGLRVLEPADAHERLAAAGVPTEPVALVVHSEVVATGAAREGAGARGRRRPPPDPGDRLRRGPPPATGCRPADPAGGLTAPPVRRWSSRGRRAATRPWWRPAPGRALGARPRTRATRRPRRRS